tara:strand:+ start:10467 stop:10991 length:525 start_codon:yes stop_codon:yes gene_type:complete
MKLSLSIAPFALLVVFMFGCASYQTGSLPDSHIAHIYLKPVQNEAFVSGVAPLYQSALREGILESRLLRLVSNPADADMVAYIRLTDFEEQPIAYLETDTGQPISARISLSAIISLSSSDSNDNDLAEDRVVSTNSAVYSAPTTAFPNPVDQTKPTMVRDLAQKTVLELELLRP